MVWAWAAVALIAFACAAVYHFGEIRTPIFESTELFARGVGEYGSVIFIAGNIPYVSEIVPLLIVTKLEQYQYPAATAIALTMLVISFLLLLAINLLQHWVRKRSGQL